MVPRWSRRNLLHTGLAVVGVSLAGCQTTARSTTTTPATTHADSVGNRTAAPAPNCPDGYHSLTPAWVVEGPGPLGGFVLALNKEHYATGEELVAELRNATDEEQTSGNKTKFDIQYRGDAGWQTIFGTPDGQRPAWTDEGIIHQPGDGFTWQFPLTRDGVSNAVATGPSYHACQPIKPGLYRFVYWGITTEKERNEDFETDYALGATFTIE